MNDDPSPKEMMLVFCTFPDLEKARAVADEIISDRLAACVNILPGVESVYVWEGEVQRDAETLAIFKVASTGFEKLERAILSRHPYDTPEVVGVVADRVERTYLSWVVSGD